MLVVVGVLVGAGFVAIFGAVVVGCFGCCCCYC